MGVRALHRRMGARGRDCRRACRHGVRVRPAGEGGGPPVLALACNGSWAPKRYVHSVPYTWLLNDDELSMSFITGG